MKKDIQGTYSAPFDKENVYTLTVDEKTLKCEVGPMTILYQYQVTGTEDGALLLKLTAPKTKTTGMLILDGNNLSIDIEGEFPLGMPWKRADDKNPPAKP